MGYFDDKIVAKRFGDSDLPAHWDYSVASRSIDGLILEFGVMTGTSINYIADRVDGHKVYGFDSFEGNPEDWYDGCPYVKGSFKHGIPEVRPNVELVIGYFADTLPKFVQEHPEPVSLIHIDCDIYSSTKTVFDNLGPQIVPGTIIMFDEYANYDSDDYWKQHEYKAFQELGREYEYLSAQGERHTRVTVAIQFNP
jgi:predicted O-methyltransferase YrrM